MANIGALSNFMLLSQYPDPVVLLNTKLEIIFTNEAYTEDFKKIKNKFFTSLIDEEQRALFQSWWSRFLSEDTKRQSSYFNCYTAQRDAEYCHLTAKKINRHNDSKPLFILISLQNLTEHQRQFQHDMEKSISKAISEVKERTELLANTSHELRTPIQTILGTAELIKESDINHSVREHCDQIGFSADILLTLINDILDYSKIEAGKIELENIPFKISELMESTAEMIAVIASKKDIDIGVYIPPEIPETVTGDPARIRQILINLCNNAVKFTTKGEVIITVDLNPQKETTDEIFITFRVADSGIGIPKEKQKHLFSAFQQADSSTTRKYGGTGLGLYISKSFVRQMGGEIFIKSEEGIGTTFFVSIPFSKKTIKKEQPLPSLFFSNRTVLVVDDNRKIRKILVQYLSEWGVQTFEATNGLEAAELLKKKASEKQPIDICLADQHMPKWGGWQLAREIHSNTELSDTKAILLLLRGKGMEEAAMMKLGWAKAYLRKPIRKERLFEVLFHVLNNSIELRDNELALSENPTVLEGIYDVQIDQNRLILIVEDHITNQQLFNSFLSKEGFLVSLASNGSEAVEKVKEKNFAMIFMDCQMPIMNGYDATVKIRELGYTMPIVAITAGTFETEWQKCSNAGMNDLLPKPFKKRDVIQCAMKHLNLKQEEK